MPTSRRRVLVVEDEPQVAAMLNDVLTTLGYAVQLAETGADALQAVPEFKPDVVLLDMALPGIPGEIVLDRLHTSDAHLPVIMLTGNQDPELARYVLERGAFDYIAKPFSLVRLREVLEAALVFRTR
jgi:DNA-binding response OmpR family regulator